MSSKEQVIVGAQETGAQGGLDRDVKPNLTIVRKTAATGVVNPASPEVAKKETQKPDRKKTVRKEKSVVPPKKSESSGERTKPEPPKVDSTSAPRESRPYRDIFNSLQQLVRDVKTLYLIPPCNFVLFSTPAVVLRTPISFKFIPNVYRFDYAICLLKVNGTPTPMLHVQSTEFKFGRFGTAYEVDIEYQFVEKCFDQSTVRDYSTLVNSIFPTVNRGLANVPKASYDFNGKAEAIAALYLDRHPNLNAPISAILRTFSQYAPIVEGVYAIGGTKSVEGEPSPAKIEWGKDPTPCETWYVSRLLDPKYKGVIYPYYMPAHTRDEVIKALSKRLTPPPRIPATFHGVDFGLDRSRDLVRECAIRIVRWSESRWASVRFLDHEEIFMKCVKHARQRFTSESDIRAYIDGARIALDEDIHSPLFVSCIQACTNVDCFYKGESYHKFNPARFIMCPAIRERGFTHALLMNAQRRLFGDTEETHNPWCVKHMTEEERKELVIRKFGISEVCNTDYSAMESSVSAFHMEDIEQVYFMQMCAPDERAKIGCLWNQYKRSEYFVRHKNFNLRIMPMRLSGQEHTSSGNFICNSTWLVAMITMISGQFPDLNKLDLLAEGDDGLFPVDIPLVDGSIYHVNPEDFTLAARALGASLKIDIYPRVDQSSFCGIALTPSLDAHGLPRDLLSMETYKTLAKVLWDPCYDRMTSKHDSAKLYARCLSFLPRALGNKELYKALWYLAYNNQPSKRVLDSAHFKTIWIRTFYKGELEDMPMVEDASLATFANKFSLPNLGNIHCPDLLIQPGPNDFEMEVVDVERPKSKGLLERVWDWFMDTPDVVSSEKIEILEDPETECWPTCAWRYHDVPAEDVAAPSESRRYCFSNLHTLALPAPTLVRFKGKFYVITPGDEERNALDEEPRGENSNRLRFVDIVRVDDAFHARLVEKDLMGDVEVPDTEKTIGARISGAWPLFVALLFVLMVVFSFYSFGALFTNRLYGVPLYSYYTMIAAWVPKLMRFLGWGRITVAQPMILLLGVFYGLNAALWIGLVAIVLVLAWLVHLDVGKVVGVCSAGAWAVLRLGFVVLRWIVGGLNQVSEKILPSLLFLFLGTVMVRLLFWF